MGLAATAASLTGEKMQLKKNITAVMLVVFSILAVSSYLPAAYSHAQAQIAREIGETYNKEVSCLAENIYYEAGKESYEGKLAVAQVTMNRVNSGRFADTVCGVVKQKINGVCQFSWYCMQVHSNKNKYDWEESVYVARKALEQAIVHSALAAQNAMFYHNNQVNPGWRLRRVATIGNHIFYK